ncbi:TetR/AcrR family transcriptional regulator [Actinoplanes bogorensis]|uniref:TetR/AcrR family transcriptional regulator n=2 Tax=Paractinoplanes bogorensis TaxID=1610840 RepID=A0ABS5Z1W9_9ACTN|nr:TetR/AcrR family transcriptional regulator [Actinoplanes bogorensis]
MRADARRNYEQILAAAEAEVARAGADASLEEIARRAGVGSATLHRHFPSRQSLLEAVFHDRVVALCDRAHQLAAAGDDPGRALADWLRELAAYGATTRGLAKSLLGGTPSGPSGTPNGPSGTPSTTASGPSSTPSTTAGGPGGTPGTTANGPSSTPNTTAGGPGGTPGTTANGPSGTPNTTANGPGGSPSTTASTCEALLVEAGDELLRPAQAAGAVRPEVTIVDLLTLVNAVSLATETSPDAGAEAARLATLALDGVRPRL